MPLPTPWAFPNSALLGNSNCPTVKSVLPIFRAASAVLAVCGCSDDLTGCSARIGTYRATYRERSGDCGDIAEAIITSDDQSTQLPDGCTEGEVRNDDHECSVTLVDVRCELSDSPGYSMVTNGKATWERDASTATGVVAIRFFDAQGRPICSSSYELTQRRL